MRVVLSVRRQLMIKQRMRHRQRGTFIEVDSFQIRQHRRLETVAGRPERIPEMELRNRSRILPSDRIRESLKFPGTFKHQIGVFGTEEILGVVEGGDFVIELAARKGDCEQ